METLTFAVHIKSYDIPFPN